MASDGVHIRQQQPCMLPVTEARQAIVRLIRKHPAVILVGETGSGKTTQVPQYVWDDLLSHRPANERGIVGCTQPRRVAAVSIARHVAQLRGGVVGGEVAYAVRFDDTCSAETRIKYMTDGILLREIQSDPDLTQYSCILLDEAHERTLHGDVLFGLLKDIARRRRHGLKIVVMSATLNADQFSQFWWNAPIGVVHGRTFPVTILHTVEPQADYVEAAVSAILQIHEKEPPGDVLCFLTGQEEIEDARRILEQRMRALAEDTTRYARAKSDGATAAGDVRGMQVLPLYAALPYEQQLRVFDAAAPGTRKVILATNIAETSITVEGIKYVVDSGVIKAKFFSSKTGMETLTEVDISRAQATQRAGRAGRMAAGKCFRLYTASAFESLQESTTPEIRRSSLVSVVLQMKSLHIDNVLGFEFMDMPDAKAVAKAEETLMLLQALDRQGKITALGLRLTDFPVDPMAAMTLLAGKAMGVAQDVIVIMALSSTENLFLASRESKAGVDRCKSIFAKSAGDHATLLSIYHAYRRVPRRDRKAWCESHAISHRQMLKAQDVMTQLGAILESKTDAELLPRLIPASLLRSSSAETGTVDGKDGEPPGLLGQPGALRDTLKRARGADGRQTLDALETSYGASMGDATVLLPPPGGATMTAPKPVDFELPRRALCFGYFLHAAYFNAKLGMYQTIVGQLPVHVHPSSVLFSHRRKPALVLFSSVVRTTKRYMKEVSVVHEQWLQEAAPAFLTPAT